MVRPDSGRVHTDQGQVHPTPFRGLRDQALQQGFEDTGVTPLPETVVHGRHAPNRSGVSRHCAPVRNFQITPSNCYRSRSDTDRTHPTPTPAPARLPDLPHPRRCIYLLQTAPSRHHIGHGLLYWIMGAPCRARRSSGFRADDDYAMACAPADDCGIEGGNGYGYPYSTGRPARAFRGVRQRLGWMVFAPHAPHDVVTVRPPVTLGAQQLDQVIRQRAGPGNELLGWAPIHRQKPGQRRHDPQGCAVGGESAAQGRSAGRRCSPWSVPRSRPYARPFAAKPRPGRRPCRAGVSRPARPGSTRPGRPRGPPPTPCRPATGRGGRTSGARERRRCRGGAGPCRPCSPSSDTREQVTRR